MPRSSKLALVYLARQAEGAEPIHRFVASYRKFDAAEPHDLIVIFKGYQEKKDRRDAAEAFDGLCHRAIEISDEGFDIGAYLTAARALDHEYICFVNTFTEIESPGWLALLHKHAMKPSIGIVGAMGSYESLHDSLAFTGKSVWLCGIKRIPYDEILQRYFAWALDRHAPGWKFGHCDRRIDLLLRLVRRRFQRSALDKEFPKYWTFVTDPGGPLEFCKAWQRFPNPHLRSNCFLIKRTLLLSLGLEVGPTKTDSYRFESGPNNMTSRLRKLGLAAIVVGRDDFSYDVADWPMSRTFRLGLQDNLLVTDNQVRSFSAMSEGERITHIRMTWGDYTIPPPADFPGLGFSFSKGDLSPQ
jgi:hypothetical protein